MISITLFALATIMRAVMATLSFRHEESVFSMAKKGGFFGENSYLRKYRKKTVNNIKGLVIATPSWYTQMFKIKYKEAFPLSTTALVWLTDGWHLAQFIMGWCIVGAMMLFPANVLMDHWLIVIIILKAIWSGAFELFYSNFLIKK